MAQQPQQREVSPAETEEADAIIITFDSFMAAEEIRLDHEFNPDEIEYMKIFSVELSQRQYGGSEFTLPKSDAFIAACRQKQVDISYGIQAAQKLLSMMNIISGGGAGGGGGSTK
jgi:hypothetical protein